MNTESRERLSALLDDELNTSERAGALNQLADNEQRQLWDRWHLIGDAMRGEAWRYSAGGIATEVSRALESEPTILAPRAVTPVNPRWVKPALGSALAASVALLAVLVAPKLIGVGDDSNAGGAALVQTSAVLPRVTAAKPEVMVVSVPAGERRYSAAQMGTHWTVSEPEVQDRLNSYLVNHQEYAPASSMTVNPPYATIVAYGSSSRCGADRR